MQLHNPNGLRPVMLFLILGWSTVLWSQAVANESHTIPDRSLDNLVQGRLYFANYFPIKGSPFLTKKWSLGDVHLLDKDYHALPLWYDIYLDELVLLQQEESNLQFVRLNKDHIQRFSFEGRQFVHLKYSRYRDLEVENGYYEVALQDKVSLLVKRKLEVKEDGETLASFFSRKDRWLLIQNGQAFYLQNKKDLLTAAGKTHQGDLSSFIKKQKIRFKKAGDAEWLSLVTYLNTLQSDGL